MLLGKSRRLREIENLTANLLNLKPKGANDVDWELGR